MKTEIAYTLTASEFEEFIELTSKRNFMNVYSGKRHWIYSFAVVQFPLCILMLIMSFIQPGPTVLLIWFVCTFLGTFFAYRSYPKMLTKQIERVVLSSFQSSSTLEKKLFFSENSLTQIENEQEYKLKTDQINRLLIEGRFLFLLYDRTSYLSIPTRILSTENQNKIQKIFDIAEIEYP
ncbi:MAG: hypothetical protein MK193_02270 [Lentisphaeria bacterium]|nr:hypothetical protein [Lentisphaeria bacterium]